MGVRMGGFTAVITGGEKAAKKQWNNRYEMISGKRDMKRYVTRRGTNY